MPNLCYPAMILFASICKGNSADDNIIGLAAFNTQSHPYFHNVCTISHIFILLLEHYLGDHIPRRVSNCNLLSFSDLCSKYLSFLFTNSQINSEIKGNVNAIR